MGEKGRLLLKKRWKFGGGGGRAAEADERGVPGGGGKNPKYIF